MIVAGIGCRRGASAAEIAAAIDAALAQARLRAEALGAMATAASKGDSASIAAVAGRLGLPLMLIAQPELAAAAARTRTRSERVLALMNVPSVAEAAALAAGGPTARLLLPRIALGPATCALAERPEP